MEREITWRLALLRLTDDDVKVIKTIYQSNIPFTLNRELIHENDILKLVLSPYCYLFVKNNKSCRRIEQMSGQSVDLHLQALKTLHNLDLVHRDVEWSNVLFNPKTEEYVLIDFESAGRVNQKLPEYLQESNVKNGSVAYSTSIDIFLVGQMI